MANQEFIPADKFKEADESDVTEVTIERPQWEVTLTELANNKAQRVTVPRQRDVKRKQVVNAFMDAFQLIGGVPRLAIWADENPTEFYRLYSKLMPKEEHKDTSGDLTIRHILPRGPLDGD